jgi:hypothetical protein
MKVTKGQQVIITNNSIFKIMGFDKVTGEVFHVRDDGFSFKCKETGCMETCDYGDGEIASLH